MIIRYCKHLVIASTLVLMSTGISFSGVINAKSCSQDDVEAAISSASNGDTIYIPKGSATWSSKIPIEKEVAVIGAGSAGSNKTSIRGFGFAGRNGTDNWRVSGIEFIGSGTTAIDGSDVLFTVGKGHTTDGCMNFRIDNCVIRNAFRGLWVHGHSTGVIDHNTFQDIDIGCVYVWGDNNDSWRRDLKWGSSDFVFIEDNLFLTTFEPSAHAISGGHGGRYVFRYNKIVDKFSNKDWDWDDAVDMHGYCHGSKDRSNRAAEVYGNTFFRGSESDGWQRVIQLRGGTALIYDNIFDESEGEEFAKYLQLVDYRASMLKGLSSTCAYAPARYCPESEGGEGYPCFDQLGRGMDQWSEPAYIWGNKDHRGNHIPDFIYVESGSKDYIKNYAHNGETNPDFYDNGQLPPNYQAHKYPHFLVDADSDDPLEVAEVPGIPTIPTDLYFD